MKLYKYVQTLLLLLELLKPFNCLQIICINNELWQRIINSYLKPNDYLQVICIK